MSDARERLREKITGLRRSRDYWRERCEAQERALDGISEALRIKATTDDEKLLYYSSTCEWYWMDAKPQDFTAALAAREKPEPC